MYGDLGGSSIREGPGVIWAAGLPESEVTYGAKGTVG